MYVNQQTSHGGERIHTATPPPCRQPPRPQGLSLGNFNICNGRGSRLAQAIQAEWIGGFGLMILMETNITGHDYCCIRMGHNAVCLQAITTATGNV